MVRPYKLSCDGQSVWILTYRIHVENLDLTISSLRPSLNKIELGFKSSRTHSKGLSMKKVNQTIYKCSHYNIFVHLEPFCLDKLRRSKGSNIIPFRTTNTPNPKKTGYQRWNQVCFTWMLYNFHEASVHIKWICEKQRVYFWVYNNSN